MGKNPTKLWSIAYKENQLCGPRPRASTNLYDQKLPLGEIKKEREKQDVPRGEVNTVLKKKREKMEPGPGASGTIQ